MSDTVFGLTYTSPGVVGNAGSAARQNRGQS